jgi:hypothetical protein
MNYKKMREEPLKSAIQQDYFGAYRYTQLGNIDFVIAKHVTENSTNLLFEDLEEKYMISILWAEAKAGIKHDIYESFVQLILTIGKEKTKDKYLPPKYIGAFDAEKIAFINYHEISDFFTKNDFNWNVSPSNHDTKEFKEVYSRCKEKLEENAILFRYETQSKELKEFIKTNFKLGKDLEEKIPVTKNNFTFVFQRWNEVVKQTIAVDWEKTKKIGIISADFFLADLLSENNESLKENLYVVLKNKSYELEKEVDEYGFEYSRSVKFIDGQKAHKEFWSIYSRPPKEEYWDYIIGRRDLLVPQDIRERKGSFFTPQIWVEKSQKYLADVLGEYWQDEYYIWDCCAGTGNLLNGLTNYDNVWASTLDKQDVDVMHDRIQNGWKTAENHVFQFDFLNDDLTRCPEELQQILTDEKRRKKLVVYINPPYAEAGNKKEIQGTGKNKDSLSISMVATKYADFLGKAKNELYAQFFIRIFYELKGCILGEFSKTKIFQAINFITFRKYFNCDLKKVFLVPANTFDNVTGEFPIGFFIWNTNDKRNSEIIDVDVYDKIGNVLPSKKIEFFTETTKDINKWISEIDKDNNSSENLGALMYDSSDFQAFDKIVVTNREYKGHHHYPKITSKNIIPFVVYFAVRLCIPHTWLNDRDQFLYPSNSWKDDFVFHTDCLIFTLFHGQNRISSAQGINHWIPFSREQVGCKKTFKSNFMNEFLTGKIKTEDKKEIDLFTQNEDVLEQKKNLFPLHSLSSEAKAVYDSGLELWKYYHYQKNASPDASFYDIRKYFQGESNGRMNNDSEDFHYMELIGDLRIKQKKLAEKIAVKVYKYEFLK